MAAVPDETRLPVKRSRRETRNDGGSALSTYGLLLPMLVVLGLFFLAPLYYIFMFSVALRRFSPTDALAMLNGELNSFTLQLWGKLVNVPVDVMQPGGIDFTVPTMVVAIVFIVLLMLAVGGGRISKERGSWIVGISFVLLLLPFFTIPAGNNLIRVEIGRAHV